MSVDPLDQGLSHMVRRQLYELRIDLDGGPRAAGGPPGRRFTAWRPHHKRALLTAGTIGLVLVVIMVGFVVATRTQHSPQASSPATIAISLGDVTVQTTAPAYQRFSMGAGLVVVHLSLHNPNATPAVLIAGDLVLVNDHGGVFPVSWRDADGLPRDGLAAPEHTLLGLDPGADARIDLPFLIMGGGPFVVRSQRRDELVRGAPPTIALVATQAPGPRGKF